MTARTLSRAALALLLPLMVAACDFSAIENPADDFDLIIELPPINTVVNGQVVDATTMQPVPNAKLTFTGEAAARLIDAYSDPIQEVKAKHGVVSFGVDNGLVPSEDSPVKFRVKASAEGYFANTQEVVLTETGNGDFLIRLPRNNPATQTQGAAGKEDKSATTSANGATTAAVTVQTPATQGTQTQATVTVPQGTVARTQSGQALTGQLTTTLRVYDAEKGLAELPESAKQNDEGGTRAVVGGVFFKVTDASGNAAATFDGGTSAAGKTAGTCPGGVEVFVKLPETLFGFHYIPLFFGSEPKADVWAYTPADDKLVKVGQGTLESGDAGQGVRICLGGSAPTVDASLLGDVREGVFYTYSTYGGPSTCGLRADLDLQANFSFETYGIIGRALIDRLALEGPGVSIERHSFTLYSLGLGLHDLGGHLGYYGRTQIFDGASYTLTATVGGKEFSTQIANPCYGSYSLDVRSAPTVEPYTINASLACPVGQKFDVQLTEESVDALSVSYKKKGSSDAYTFLRSKDVTRSVSESSIMASTQLTLQPSTTYQFHAVYGSSSTTREVTTPAAGSAIDLSFNPAEADLTCKRK